MTWSTSPISSGSSARGRLVEQEHLRLHAQRACDRDALLLAAGEPRRVLVALLDQADLLEVVLGRAGPPPSRGTPQTRIGASMQFPSTVMWGKRLNSWNSMPARSRIWRICSWCCAARALKRIGLEHEPVDLDRSDGRLLEEVDAAQEGRLAAAGAADDHHRLALADLEVHAAQDVVVAEVLLDRRRPRSTTSTDGRCRSRRAHRIIGRPVPGAAPGAPGRS